MTAADFLVYFLAASNVFLLFIIYKTLQNKNAVSQDTRNDNVEVKYFEYIEEASGKVTNTKKFIIKGQIFVNGLPVGQQFVMSEHIIEEFSYEKLKQFKNEVIYPVLQMGAKVAESFLSKKTAGASTLVTNLAKSIKSKAS